MCQRMSASTRRLLSIVLIGLCTAVPAVAAADDDPVFEGEVTVTATGEETEVDAVPVPVTVVSREEIDDSQAESVAALLRRVPGVTVMGTEGTGQVVSTFTRGTNSNHTLFLYDGVRLNSPLFGGFDATTLTTAGAARIEVARGPYSALWGAEALGGAVNVVPIRGATDATGTLFAEGGEDGFQRYEGDVRWGSDRFDVAASGLYREGEGALDNSDFQLTQGMIDGGYRWGQGSRIGILYQDVDSEAGIPFSSPGSLTPLRRSESDQQLLAIPVRWVISDLWRLEVTASRVERRFHFEDPDDPSGFTLNDSEADTDQIRIASHHTFGAHAATFGAEWREDDVTNVTSFGSNLDGQTTEISSLFAQDVWQVNDRLRAVAGLRWDDTDEWGSETSPRLHLGWTATADLELTAGWGHAFRQPSVGEMYYPFSGTPDLEPEVADSWEVGAVWRAPTTGSRVRVSYFDTGITDLIQYDFVTFTNQNIGEAEIQGAEFSWEQGLGAALSSLFQVTWLDTEDAATGEALLRRPRWSASATVHGRFTSWLTGDLTVRYVGERKDVDATTFLTVDAESFTTADLALAVLVWEGVEITVRAINLLDEDYQEVSGYPAPGRRISGGLRYDF
jgi:vitamin B12 transporter